MKRTLEKVWSGRLGESQGECGASEAFQEAGNG